MSTANNLKHKLFKFPQLAILALMVSTWGLLPTVGLAQNKLIKATSAQLETLYLNNDRTYSYNLVAQNRGVIDGIVIPAGATIVGQYDQPKADCVTLLKL